jgi:nitrite reductase (cytochrome c-552)
MSDTPNAPTSASPGTPPAGRRQWLIYAALILGAAVVTLVVAAVLVTIFEHKQQARTPFVRVVEIDEISTDPAPWGMNWPRHYDGYRATADHAGYGGSSAMSQSKLDVQPWLKRLYAGYAFSIDYREARGHAYMLHDQKVTERVTKRKQAGACLHCHASATVAYRKAGLEALGRPADEATLRKGFDMEAVIAGFVAVSRKPYHEVLALMEAAPDGTPDDDGAVGGAHPVSCIDCHDPATMKIRVTRPGFVRGIAALAAGDGAAPHLPSIANWRAGDRAEAVRPERGRHAAGDALVRVRPVPRRVLLRDQGHAPVPVGQGPARSRTAREAFWDEQTLPRRHPLLRLQARGDRREGLQGAAPRV